MRGNGEAEFLVVTDATDAIHSNNMNYAILDVKQPGAFWSIQASTELRLMQVISITFLYLVVSRVGKSNKLLIRLVDAGGQCREKLQ